MRPLVACTLLTAAGERDLPGVGSAKLTGYETLPQLGLRVVARTGVREEEHVTQTYGRGAVVLGQSVLVEASEGGGEALLHLRGQRHAAVGPVDGDELGELVGTLDDARERVGHESAVRGVAGHLTHQQKRRVAQLHGGAGLDGERGDGLGRDAGYELADARGDGLPALVELVLPEHAGEYAAAQGLFGRESYSGRSFVSTGARQQT